MIDYKALAERIRQDIDIPYYCSSSRTTVSKDDLRTVASLLEGMAEERPVAWMRPDNRVREESFTGKQFSRGEQRPPIGTWNPLYLRPAPQPQPERQPVSEPTEAQIEAGARALSTHWHDSQSMSIAREESAIVLRAALAAKDAT